MKQSIKKQNKNQIHLARKLPRNQTQNKSKMFKDFVDVFQIYLIYTESQLSSKLLSELPSTTEF